MKQIIALAMILLGLHFSSCTRLRGEGPVVREYRTTPAFTAIRTACDADIFLRQDSLFSVELSGQQNVLQQLETRVSGDELKIDFDYHVRIGSHDRVQVFISCPDIKKVSISGSGNTSIGPIRMAHALGLNISGSGDIEAASISATGLDVGISGSGTIRVDSGWAAFLQTSISGSGSIDLSGVNSGQADINTSGSGDTRVFVSDLLNVRISGSGDVYYLGRPKISTKISGSGKLIPL